MGYKGSNDIASLGACFGLRRKVKVGSERSAYTPLSRSMYSDSRCFTFRPFASFQFQLRLVPLRHKIIIMIAYAVTPCALPHDMTL